MSLLHRNKLFPWKWNETPLNEASFRNQHFPLPLTGTHYFFPSPQQKNNLSGATGAILESEKTLGTSHEIEVLLLVFLPAIPAGSLSLFPAIIFMIANVCGTCGENLGQILKGSQRQTCTDSQRGFCGCVALSNAVKFFLLQGCLLAIFLFCRIWSEDF